MKKFFALIGFSVFAFGVAANASMILTLQGKVYSLTQEKVVLQVEDQLFTLKRDQLDESDLKQTEKANSPVTFYVPFEAIEKVAPLAQK